MTGFNWVTWCFETVDLRLHVLDFGQGRAEILANFLLLLWVALGRVTATIVLMFGRQFVADHLLFPFRCSAAEVGLSRRQFFFRPSQFQFQACLFLGVRRDSKGNSGCCPPCPNPGSD